MDALDKDAEKRKRDLLAQLQGAGAGLSAEQQEQLMGQLEDNLAKIGEVLQRDEQDQEEALRRKLEARAARRRRLQDALKDKEKVVEEQREQLQAKKEEVEQQALEALEKAEAEIQREAAARAEALKEDLERAKIERLANFEDQLREASGADFGRVLDGYQEASKRVEQELERERLKQ